MQNKGKLAALLSSVIAVLLILVCAFYLSFTIVNSNYETAATDYAHVQSPDLPARLPRRVNPWPNRKSRTPITTAKVCRRSKTLRRPPCGQDYRWMRLWRIPVNRVPKVKGGVSAESLR